MPRGRSGTPGEGGDGDADDEEAGASKFEEGRGRMKRGRETEGEAGEVMWEVGSVSDDDDDDVEGGKDEEGAGGRRGIGGGDVRGERRGWLFDEEDERGRGGSESPTATKVEVPREAERNPFADDGEGFGEFEAVSTPVLGSGAGRKSGDGR
jgi:hypothetical protein